MTKFWKVPHFDFVRKNQFGQISLINRKLLDDKLYKFQENFDENFEISIDQPNVVKSPLQGKLKLLISNNHIESVSQI